MDSDNSIGLGREMFEIKKAMVEFRIYKEITNQMLVKLIEKDGDKVGFVDLLNSFNVEQPEYKEVLNGLKSEILSALAKIPERA